MHQKPALRILASLSWRLASFAALSQTRSRKRRISLSSRKVSVFSVDVQKWTNRMLAFIQHPLSFGWYLLSAAAILLAIVCDTALQMNWPARMTTPELRTATNGTSVVGCFILDPHVSLRACRTPLRLARSTNLLSEQ